MKSYLNNLIEVVGISDILPKYAKDFKQFQIQEMFNIPIEKPDIEQILSISVNVEIIETLIIKTPIATSNEGQILKGKKLLVRGKLIQKLEYVANTPDQSVHAAEGEKLFAEYIVLDRGMDCNQAITVIPYIEDIYVKQINKRVVFKNVMILIDAVSSMHKLPNCEKYESEEEKLVERHNRSMHCRCKCEREKYFTQFVSMENIRIPDVKPDMEQIVSTIVDPEIISMKVVNTTKGISREGQKLTGKKIVVELKIKQKVLYVADVMNQSIHGVENEFYQSVYVVVPKCIEGTDSETLLKNKLLQPKLKVEDVFVMQIDKRRIFKNVTLLLEFCYIPTYQICYSSHKNCTSSNLAVMYESGEYNSQITFDENKKNVKPSWGPDGQSIAYLSGNNGSFCINVVNIRSLSNRQITFQDKFDSIDSFSWSMDGKKIFFSGIKDNSKDIFSVDISTLKCYQLTNGNGLIKSYKPNCSRDGAKIAYIRAINELSDLWISDIDGFNTRKITSLGYIKDFDWCSDKRTVIAISSKGSIADELYSIDIEGLETKKLLICDDINEKSSIRISPDDKYVAFLGSKCSNTCFSGLKDIFIYEFASKALINLTENSYEVKISELIWKADSSKIYYTSNELGFYNVYSISLVDFCKKQLTNTEASNMELSYRPKIK